MKELQSYELMLNDSQMVRRSKANIDVASFLNGKVKRAKKGKAKAFRLLQMENNRSIKSKDLSNFKCFFCTKKGNFKPNCKE
ncbi:hypothetical protein PVK06_026878 [Gossypium arboreum]|uniref:Uncharacterized protein n=1 Tax=Gossypium arboreum TaxID=29729 RepID=A0ABR0NZC6_GOSAR|nr:hypothetical protein PVK06_026878 [Gossypium arboreum]